MGSPPAQNDAEPDPRITALVNEFFDRRRGGEELTPEQFAAEHPDAAELLRLHLGGLPLIAQACLSDAAHATGATGPLSMRPDAVVGYRLQREVGRGGMGVVYQALQLSTKRVVALKLMLAGPFASMAGRGRFAREVELAARLQHPGIVRVLEGGAAAGQPYYSMEYIAGARLDQYIASPQTDRRAALGLFIRLCAAVEYAHGHGVIHRDLKPANVLVDAEGEPHILDFGLAKAVSEAETDGVSACVSSPGQVLGTLFYLAPEQAAGEPSQIDRRTDVYALGLMLYEALTGALPFDTAGRPSDVLQRILEAPPIPPRTRSPQVDTDLEAILLKALEKEPARRYQSARELGDDLQRYLNGEPILARPPSRIYVLGKRLRKHRVFAGTTIAVVGLLLAAWAVHLRRAQHDVEQARRTLLACQHAVEAGKAARVLGLAETVLDRHPEIPEAALVCAHVAYRITPGGDAAVAVLEQQVRDHPGQPWPSLLLAEMYRGSGKTALLADLHLPAASELPDDAEAWYVRSFATLDLQKALQCAEQAVQRAPRHPLAWERITFLRLQAGDFAGALQGVDRLTELTQGASEWNWTRARILARQGRLEEALAEYTNLGAFVYRAHIYRRLGQYAQAADDYTQSLAGNPTPSSGNVWIRYQRATPLWILGRTEEALADYRHVRNVQGRAFYGDARSYLILRDLGRDQEANEVLAAALREVQDPWLEQILRCLRGELPAEDLVTRAAAAGSPEQLCEAYYYAGEACRLVGQGDVSRRFFTACVATGMIYDPDAGDETPMNEYELAQWRLRGPTTSAASTQP